MERLTYVFSVFIGVISLTGSEVLAQNVGTAFTYQGNLILMGTPVSNTCEFEFTLWDNLVGGSQIGAMPAPAVTIAKGQFTMVLLDSPMRGT